MSRYYLLIIAYFLGLASAQIANDEDQAQKTIDNMPPDVMKIIAKDFDNNDLRNLRASTTALHQGIGRQPIFDIVKKLPKPGQFDFNRDGFYAKQKSFVDTLLSRRIEKLNNFYFPPAEVEIETLLKLDDQTIDYLGDNIDFIDQVTYFGSISIRSNDQTERFNHFIKTLGTSRKKANKIVIKSMHIHFYEDGLNIQVKQTCAALKTFEVSKVIFTTSYTSKPAATKEFIEDLRSECNEVFKNLVLEIEAIPSGQYNKELCEFIGEWITTFDSVHLAKTGCMEDIVGKLALENESTQMKLKRLKINQAHVFDYSDKLPAMVQKLDGIEIDANPNMAIGSVYHLIASTQDINGKSIKINGDLTSHFRLFASYLPAVAMFGLKQKLIHIEKLRMSEFKPSFNLKDLALDDHPLASVGKDHLDIHPMFLTTRLFASLLELIRAKSELFQGMNRIAVGVYELDKILPHMVNFLKSYQSIYNGPFDTLKLTFLAPKTIEDGNQNAIAEGMTELFTLLKKLELNGLTFPLDLLIDLIISPVFSKMENQKFAVRELVLVTQPNQNNLSICRGKLKDLPVIVSGTNDRITITLSSQE